MEDFKMIGQATKLMQVWMDRHNATRLTLDTRAPLVDQPTEFDEVMDDYDGGWQKTAYLRTASPTARAEYEKIVALVSYAKLVKPQNYNQRRDQLLAWGYPADAVNSVPYVGSVL